jgi:uncharacterized protein YecE (DUF72 family)
MSEGSACRLRIGTSGYSYAEWTEAGFYPPGTRAGHMLSLYARRFSTTELNFTWYQMPKADALRRMQAQVPDSFRFAVKLTRTMTHEIDPETWPDGVRAFRDGIAPLILAGQLAAVLVQLPPSFRRSPDNRRYLARLLDALGGLPLAVELRHASWAADKVFADFEARGIALVAVDVPDLPGLFPPTDVVTRPDLLYVRLHGRNVRGWRSGKMHQQFDYDYTDDELQGWIETRLRPMIRQARAGVVYFNNHVRAQAPRNAERLVDLLAGEVEAWSGPSST